MQDLIVVLGAAAIVATLFHLVKVPPIVAFFTAGAVIGPNALGLVTSPPKVELMSEGAALILMFTVGLEFSFKELKSFRRPLIFLGFGQILMTIAFFSCALSLILDFPMEKSIFWSFIITLSSTAVVLKVLSDHRDFESPHGKSTFAILLSQDLAVIPMLITIPFLQAGSSLGPDQSLIESIFPIILLVATGGLILYVVSNFALPAILHKVAQTKNREVFFFFVVFVVALFAITAHKFGLSYSMGAFIAGMLISGSAYGRQASADFKPLRDAFLGIFFVTIGMLLDLRFLVENLPKVLAIGTVVLGAKAFIIFMMVWLTGNSATVARIVAIFIFQMGEFSFILADQGLKLGLIRDKELQYFLAVAIISLAITPFVYRLMPFLSHADRYRHLLPEWISKPMHSFRGLTTKYMHARLTDQPSESAHTAQADVLIVGFGVAGRALAKVLKATEISYHIIESNGDTVREFSENQAEPIQFGDAASVDILESAGIMSAKLCVILTSGISTLDPIIHSVRRLRPEIPIVARTNYLLDLERLNDFRHVNMVVSEFETTLETMVRVLTKLNVPSQLIEDFSEDLKSELEKTDTQLELR